MFSNGAGLQIDHLIFVTSKSCCIACIDNIVLNISQNVAVSFTHSSEIYSYRLI